MCIRDRLGVAPGAVVVDEDRGELVLERLDQQGMRERPTAERLARASAGHFLEEEQHRLRGGPGRGEGGVVVALPGHAAELDGGAFLTQQACYEEVRQHGGGQGRRAYALVRAA